MNLLALVLAASAALQGVATELPPAPSKVYSIAWQRRLVEPGTLEWKPQELGGPAVDPVGGLVVVGTRDGWVHAYDPDGHRLWAFETGGRIGATPRIEGDVVYVGSGDGCLYALDLASGQQRWRYDAQEDVGTTPVVAGGLVLAMTLQDTLFAVDQKTGAWRWHHRREMREGFTVEGAASVVAANGLALGGYSDGTVAALDLASGAVRWERKVAPAGDFVDVDGLRLQGKRLFVAAYSGAVYALDVDTGAQEWAHKTAGATRLALGPGILVAVTTTQLVGLSPLDGSLRWSAPLDGAPAGPPAASGGRLAIPNTRSLLLVDGPSGRVLRAFNPGTGISASPAFGARRLYVLSNAGDLFALDLG